MEFVCRTCLRIIGNDYSATYLNQPKHNVDAVTVRQKLEACVPELTVDIVLEPTICGNCTEALNQAYKFKSICLETEKTLFKCIRRRRHSTHCTDLLTTNDLLKISRKDINEEHSYSFVDKTHDYITDSDSEDELSLNLPTIVRSTLGAFVEQATRSKSASPQKSSAGARRSKSLSPQKISLVASKLLEKAKPEVKTNFQQRRVGRGRKATKALVAGEKSSPKGGGESKVLKEGKKNKDVDIQNGNELRADKHEPRVKEGKRDKAVDIQSDNKLRADKHEPRVKESKRDKAVDIQNDNKLRADKHAPRVKESKRDKAVDIQNDNEQEARVKEGKRNKAVDIQNDNELRADKHEPRVKEGKKDKAVDIQNGNELRADKQEARVKEGKRDKDVEADKHELRNSRELKKHKHVKRRNNKASKERKDVEGQNEAKVPLNLTPKETKDKKRKESKVTKDSKQSPKANNPLTSPTRNGSKDRKQKNLIKSDKNGYDGAATEPPHFEYLETIENFSSNSIDASTQASARKMINKLEVSSEVVVESSELMDDDKGEPAPAFVPIENNVKRKQRKQARPKKKPMDESNKEEDIPKIVSYPRLCKMSRRIFSVSKPTEDESPTKDDNENVQANQAADLQSDESVSKQGTITNDMEPMEFDEPHDEDNQQDNSIDSSNDPTIDKEVFSPATLNLIKDMPIFALTNRRWKIGLQGLARIRDKAIARSDVVESLNTVWHTTEKKRYQCTKCSKGYNYKCHFDVHLKSHIFKKLYSCPICDKSFTQEKYLKTHAITHAKNGMYQCEVCHKKLSASTALKRHIRTHTGEKPYPCSICSKSFAQKIQLAVHMRTHTGYRPFSCNVCSASFTQKSHLLGHTRIHTGEKPFACDICPKRFRKSYALQIHQESHSQKPYQCKGCNHLFKDRGTYHRHINKQLLNCVKGRASMLKSEKRSPIKSRRRRELNMEADIDDKDDMKGDFRKLHLFYCNTCDKGFSTKFSRNRHMRVHLLDL